MKLSKLKKNKIKMQILNLVRKTRFWTNPHQESLKPKYLRERPFNLKGGEGIMVLSKKIF